jgi:solute carrier family 25 S-adenosylmethionine transporter 26
MGDLTGSIWLCPGELVKQNLQAGTFTSRGEAISHIWKTNGPRGFYRGYGSTVSRDVPFRVAQLTTYECLKGMYIRYKSSQQLKHLESGFPSVHAMYDISSSEAAVIGGFAGAVATVITQPM